MVNINGNKVIIPKINGNIVKRISINGNNVYPSKIKASGGTTIVDKIINGKEYRIHDFENTGSDTFSVNFAPHNAVVDVLVVGGGGGGGSFGGGGGAGGVVFSENKQLSEQYYNIIVG